MKRAMMLLVLGGVLASSGCASRVNNVMQSWVGHHYTNLLMSWGPPSAIYEDGQGGRILVWAYNRQMTTPGSATTMTRAQAQAYGNQIWVQAQSYTQFVPPQTMGYTAWRMFQADRRGYIYNWSWRGL